MSVRVRAKHPALRPTTMSRQKGLASWAPSIVQAGSTSHLLFGKRPGIDLFIIKPSASNAQRRAGAARLGERRSLR